MFRKVIDAMTGEMLEVPLTQEELDAAAAAKAAEDEYNSLDNRALRAVDAVDRLQFAMLFDHENRLRVLEGQGPVTQAQFRQGLLNRWKQQNT